jgi:hypothetical protein
MTANHDFPYEVLLNEKALVTSAVSVFAALRPGWQPGHHLGHDSAIGCLHERPA